MIRFEKAIAYFKEINIIKGFTPDVENFVHRIIIQKTIYLLKLKDDDLNYEFNLYLRGPYCPEFTKDIFENKDRFEKFITTEKLSDENKLNTSEYIKLYDLNLNRLEAAATYTFFRHNLELEHWDAVKQTKAIKPFIPEIDLTKAIDMIKIHYPL